MYLKRIELSGFKSFADKTEFEFVPGITAIVGPNGSGKSNITDAIRWVLGEQSAKSLRGSKMEDIIFSGSDSRKPVNYAEVSLTLDNQDRTLDIDYSEVMITRRLYRSGESEYFINKQSCRLKDITELFMDTGLGKEAYSIIGQGKIDEILSSKAEERRGVFEEAAGIVKYKTRKKEAQRKLEDTEKNLVRIFDLISELEGQIAPLEEQAEVAKQYKEYANQLKDLNIKIYVHDIEKSYEEWQTTDRLKQQLSTEQLELSSKVSQVDALIEEKRLTVNQIERELEELHQQLVIISEKVEQAEGKREVLREREKNHETNRVMALEMIDKLLVKKSETTSQLEKEKEKLEQIEVKIDNLSQQLSKEEVSLNKLITDHQSQIEIYKQEFFECLNEMATIRNEIRHVAKTKESISIRIDRLQNELEQVQKELISIADEKDNLEKEIKLIQDEIVNLTDENNQILQEKNDLIKKSESIQSVVRGEQQRLNSLLSRREVLTEMQSDFAGYQHGVKEILKLGQSNRLKGIHGAVAELISVPKKYETAIEIALGGALQYIVVESEEIGRQAIAYLKNNKLGRATFLPLNVIKGKRLNRYDLDAIKDIAGYIGLASELIETNTTYTSIIDYLLGQVIIASDLKVANKIARILGYTRRVVTIEGEIVNPGGSMTGGSLGKKRSNLLGRQREIENLSAQIEEIKSKIAKEHALSREIAEKLTQVEGRIAEIGFQIESNRHKEQELQANYLQLEYEKKRITERSTYLMLEIEQLSSELKDLEIKQQDFSKSLAEKQLKEKELQENIARAESLREKDESIKEEMNKLITDLKIDLARLNQEKDGSLVLIERLSSELNEINSSIEQQHQTLIQLENDLSNQKVDQDDISQIIKNLRIEKDQIQKKIDVKRLVKIKTVQEIESKESGSKELRKKLKIAETELHKAEVKLGRLDTELQNLLRQLADEYEMSYEWARDNIDKITDINKAKEEVFKLKQLIQGLGEVNLGAIDEYDRVMERYTFLKTQKEDLVEAKQTLYQVIQEVEQEMTKLFKESFEAIREQFQLVFTRLFAGGKADLILTDPENMLETGIEIIAQPPGKKPQNLALLSGGEKALTAITLLFAILRVKPVPFSVLDEVEAALDEANVTRFSQYLREFCENTQFIIVTHRKGTMEGADVLYGVTMQESGVSRLVSVKLEEKKEKFKELDSQKALQTT
ncbi:chromosome segregation protein SMC [Vulcanibacillus modesticaldus]|uniref:Chromosome partition protein Smc n=1 Tax=Vulcanibacillus modesticaldus TaxID=337097 RepID=A0A1D2YXH4_9BACI|nr:chromosome segregation protein SMC [Vulcanibacillus modesticaldus]OEG00368.1 chromosome segregation protein SMC [Vulcanibacillus modesticaldus]